MSQLESLVIPLFEDFIPVIETPGVALKLVSEAIVEKHNISKVNCLSYVDVSNMKPMNNIGVYATVVNNVDVNNGLATLVPYAVIVSDSDCIPFSPPPDVVQQFVQTPMDCEFNQVNLDDHSSDTVNISIMSSFSSVDINDEVPLIDVFISLVSNDALIAQLAFKSNGNGMAKGDWLANCDSSTNWDVGEENDGQGNDFKKKYG